MTKKIDNNWSQQLKVIQLNNYFIFFITRCPWYWRVGFQKLFVPFSLVHQARTQDFEKGVQGTAWSLGAHDEGEGNVPPPTRSAELLHYG